MPDRPTSAARAAAHVPRRCTHGRPTHAGQRAIAVVHPERDVALFPGHEGAATQFAFHVGFPVERRLGWSFRGRSREPLGQLAAVTRAVPQLPRTSPIVETCHGHCSVRICPQFARRLGGTGCQATAEPTPSGTETAGQGPLPHHTNDLCHIPDGSGGGCAGSIPAGGTFVMSRDMVDTCLGEALRFRSVAGSSGDRRRCGVAGCCVRG